MVANMMTTQKWYTYITTKVIKGYVDALDEEYRSKLPYINERKGVPFAAMQHIERATDAAASYAYLFEHDLYLIVNKESSKKTVLALTIDHIDLNSLIGMVACVSIF